MVRPDDVDHDRGDGGDDVDHDGGDGGGDVDHDRGDGSDDNVETVGRRRRVSWSGHLRDCTAPVRLQDVSNTFLLINSQQPPIRLVRLVLPLVLSLRARPRTFCLLLRPFLSLAYITDIQGRHLHQHHHHHHHDNENVCNFLISRPGFDYGSSDSDSC